jgi:broad specificity phosphatase PhoE
LHIDEPFPGGESYTDTTRRMRQFLLDLARNYNSKKVMIIGHRATQYALESLINRRPLEEVIPEPWHWQPGWTYHLSELTAK